VAANSTGVRYPSELCRCSVLYSTLNLSSKTRACSNAPEVLFVEALVAHPPVERLAKPVLPRLAGLDVERGRADLFEPVHDLGCDELAAIVTSDHGRRSVFLEQPLQHTLDDTSRDRAGSVHASAMRVNSSTTVSTLKTRPDEVASYTMS